MNKKRGFALFVAFVMLFGAFPMKAFAEEHIHSEGCYAKEGDLLCLLEESEAHAHDENCFANGGELICGVGTVALTGEYDIAALSTENEYDDIKQLFAEDDSVEFDPDTQTLLIIDVEHIMSEHLLSLGLTDAEETIKWDEEQNGYHTPFLVSINGEKVQKNYPYYIVSKDTMSIEQTMVYATWGYGVGRVFLSADNNKVAVLVVNQGDTYDVVWEMNSDTFYGRATTGDYCNGNGLTPFPTDHQTRKAYTGTAGSAVVAMPFSFEWDLYNWLDIEIWMADPATKKLDNPGFLDVSGYINFKIELRDGNGNITLLPKCFFNNIGSGNDYVYMREEGIVSVPMEPYDDDLLPHSTPYGEFDILLPFGYDYRISLLDYSVDTLGAYAYVINQEHGYDADGFCITDKTAAYNEDKEWGSWLSYTFMPCTQTIRVEKQAEGSDSADTEYSFTVKQTAYTYSELGGYGYLNQPDVMQNLSNYPYDLYDSETGKKINEETLKTDSDGKFKLKSGQYAEMRVWEVPEDILDYERWGTNFVDDIYSVYTDVETESRYTFEELDAGDCATTITHKHDDQETAVNGKKIENVLGSDRILFLNVYNQNSAGGTLTIRKEVSGSGTPDLNTAFEFTVTKDETAAVGRYTIGDGAEQTIPADGRIYLKAGESALLTGLELGEYTVTETVPTQQNYVDTGFSVNHQVTQTGLAATVGVLLSEEAQAASVVFTNKYLSSDNSDMPDTPDVPDRPADAAPQTGDSGNIELWTVLACVSMAAMFALALIGKRLRARK